MSQEVLENEKTYARLDECIARYPQLKVCREEIAKAFDHLVDMYSKGNKLLICGNGGSAADADHISGELLKGFGHPRALAKEWTERLGEDLARNLQGALPTIPLTVFNALGTAYNNDCDGKYTFAQLTWGLGVSGDVLLAISTSGNSENVLLAVKVAKAKGILSIGLTGKTGGKLKDLVDICICAPATEVFKIQELHLPIYHSLCFMLEEKFFPKLPIS